MKLIIIEEAEYEIQQQYDGEPPAEMYQRFLDDHGIYLTGITERHFEVWGDGNPSRGRSLTPQEELAFKGVEDRS